MKLLKLFFVFSSILIAGTAIADENKYSEYSENHMPYLGCESGSLGAIHPSAGYRYQNNSYIADINIGYKYLPSNFLNFHLGKVGANIYTSFNQTDRGQCYAGIGSQIIFLKSFEKGYHKMQFIALHPSASIGRDFFIEKDKKLFLELSYEPYHIEKHNSEFIHSVGMRIGVGI